MKLSLKSSTGQNFYLDVKQTDTFKDLKEKALIEKGVILNLGQLRHKNKEVHPHMNVFDYFCLNKDKSTNSEPEKTSEEKSDVPNENGKLDTPVPEDEVVRKKQKLETTEDKEEKEFENTQNVELPDHAGQLCRLCAETGDDMMFIFSSDDLSKTINTFLPVTVSQKDPLPKQICPKCFEKVKLLEEFGSVCIKAEKVLQDYLTEKKFWYADNLNIMKSIADGDNTDKTEEKENDEANNEKSESNEEIKKVGETDSVPVGNDVKRRKYCCPLCVEGSITTVDQEAAGVSSGEESPSEMSLDEETLTDDEQFNKDAAENYKESEDNYKDVDDENLNFEENEEDVDNPDSDALMKEEEYTGLLLTCIHCSDQLYSYETLLNHTLRLHCDDHRGKYPCPLCRTVFTVDTDLTNHVRNVHQYPFSVKPRNYRCQDCGKQYTSERWLLNHKCPLVKKPMEYKCAYCKKIYRVKDKFDFHSRYHEDGVKMFHCYLCNKTFIDEKTHYYHHLSTHSDKELTCDMCSSSFSSLNELYKHLTTHKKIQMKSCSECGMQFMTKVALDQHMTSHPIVKALQCHICDKTFSSQQYLNAHLRQHEKPQVEKQESLRCRSCGETFSNQERAMVHVTDGTHANAKEMEFEVILVDKIYKCEFCERFYAVVDDLVIHRKLHE